MLICPSLYYLYYTESNKQRSGHQGTWVEDNEAAQVFDKHYYTALMDEVWRPRRINGKADWTTGNGRNRVMLDSDVSSSPLLVGY